MIRGDTGSRGISGEKRTRALRTVRLCKRTLTVAAATLLLASILQCKPALAVADCSSAPAAASTADIGVGAHSTSLHSVSLRSALHGTGTPGTVSSQASCRPGGGALVSMASALLPRSYVARPLIDGYSVSVAGGAVAREMRMEINPRIANSSPAESAATGAALERESGLEARFGVRWQTMPGPAWVQRVPSWVIQDAKTYHRRGLPVLHLWESSNYLVALGLSNHGVPGVYFSQKLP
jgi:hypothetical protein